MKRPEDNKDTLALLREVPTEVGLEQVGHMVAAFPLTVGAMAWIISTLKFNLNTILMTSSATLIIGSSAYFLSTTTPVEATATADSPTPTAIEMVVEMPEPEPAVVFELPPAKPPASRKEPPAEERAVLACTPIDQYMNDQEGDATVTEAINEDIAITTQTNSKGDEKHTTTHAGQRTFDLRGFTGVAIMGSANAVVEEGPFSVVADGDQDVLDQLKITIEGSLLRVGFDRSRGSNARTEKVDVRIRMPQLEELLVMGSGNISAGTFSKAEVLQLKVMGSGGIIFNGIKETGDLEIHVQGSGDVNCQQMNVRHNTTIHVAGSGDANVGGKTDQIEVDILGSGDVHATNLRSKGGRVNVVGSGDASVYSDGPLELTTTGSGTIHTSGSAGQNRSRGVGNDE